MLLDWTAVHHIPVQCVPVHNVNCLVCVAHKRYVQWVECVDGVVELVQVDLAGVVVAEAVHDTLHLGLGQVHAVAVEQSDQVEGVDEALVGLVDKFEEFVHVVVVAAGDLAHGAADFE